MSKFPFKFILNKNFGQNDNHFLKMNIQERVQQQFPGAVMIREYNSGVSVYRFKKNRYWLCPDNNYKDNYCVREWDFDEDRLRTDGHPEFSNANPSGPHYNLYFKKIDGVATKKVQARISKLITQYEMPQNPFINREEITPPPRPITPMPPVRDFHLDEIEEEETPIEKLQKELRESDDNLTHRMDVEHNTFTKQQEEQNQRLNELEKKCETLKEIFDVRFKTLELQCEVLFQGSMKLKERISKQKHTFERLRAVFLDTIDEVEIDN